ncbi:DUF418 domain-containing protein [Stappia indica]|uniref:DUF418 domain-containing protein n=1 Tax=Stappia indica TaxID=538381 RepID=UPI001CD40832|nr:DUF418 domain-containing protein [Stappia indica]MCA1297511.1 DUF418 domain-containing protein [Stappia indica]
MNQSIRSSVPEVGAAAIPLSRLPVLDSLRGLAALGILWRNIFVFGMPAVAFALPEEWGLETARNIATWLFVVIFVDGTMRGLFSMLFGASAVLIAAKYAASMEGMRGADLYFRRLLWLIAFGLIHGYLLLWPHDVLYVYGVLGLFLFAFRNLSGGRLLLIALVLFSISSVKDGTGWSLAESTLNALDKMRVAEVADLRAQEAEAGADAAPGEGGASAGLTDAEVEREMLAELERYALVEISERLAPYPVLLRTTALQTYEEQTTLFFADHILDIGAMMFFGMALLRLGAFGAGWPLRWHLALALGGLGLGTVLGLMIHGAATLEGWEGWSLGEADAYFYNLRRLSFCLGLVGLLTLAVRLDFARWLTVALAAVGRMALTTYVMQTAVCLLLFYGMGFALFGSLEHHELLLIGFAINAAQIVFAVMWLRRWRQGPLEWLLRRLVEGRAPVAGTG